MVRSSLLAENFEVDVVDPPKFITAKNVMNVFEKLGFDPEGGREIFTALCEVLKRRRNQQNKSLDERSLSLTFEDDRLSWGSLMSDNESNEATSSSENKTLTFSKDSIKEKVKNSDDQKDAKMDVNDFLRSNGSIFCISYLNFLI